MRVFSWLYPFKEELLRYKIRLTYLPAVQSWYSILRLLDAGKHCMLAGTVPMTSC